MSHDFCIHYSDVEFLTNSMNLLNPCIVTFKLPYKMIVENIFQFFLKSLVGVRQGDNLSPTLFNINDLPIFF